MNEPKESQEKLAEWLHSLIEILRNQGGSTWKALVRTTSGKTAVIDLDGTQLQLCAEGGEQLQIQTEPIASSNTVDFRSTAEIIRDVIAGRLVLDTALIAGDIYVRGNIQELIDIHIVVMEIIADSAINLQLQRLWEEFDETWTRPSSLPTCQTLEQQKPVYADLIRNVPEDVLNIEV